MTEPLLKSLSPRYAVISCQSDPPPHKQRPQEDVVAMLLRHVPHVLCTENRAMPQLAAVSHDAVRFVIDPQGGSAAWRFRRGERPGADRIPPLPGRRMQRHIHKTI